MTKVRDDLLKVITEVRRFWMAPTSTAPVALVRIVYGTLVALWTSTLLGPDRWFYGPEGILPEHPESRGALALLRWSHSSTVTRIVLITLLIAAVCLAIGLFSRLAGVIVFLGIFALQQRNPYVTNGGDLMFRLIALYLALAPTGAALSVDRWLRRRDRFWESPLHAPWALRLLQLQVSFVYFDSVWEKLPGGLWRGGTAVAWALANDDFSRVPGGDFLIGHDLFTNVFTYSTLVIELSLAVLIWNRRLRPWVIAGGVMLHLSIEIGMPLGFFPATMITSYVAFVPPERAERVVAWFHRRIRPAGTRPRQLVDAPLKPASEH